MSSMLAMPCAWQGGAQLPMPPPPRRPHGCALCTPGRRAPTLCGATTTTRATTRPWCTTWCPAYGLTAAAQVGSCGEQLATTRLAPANGLGWAVRACNSAAATVARQLLPCIGLPTAVACAPQVQGREHRVPVATAALLAPAAASASFPAAAALWSGGMLHQSAPGRQGCARMCRAGRVSGRAGAWVHACPT